MLKNASNCCLELFSQPTVGFMWFGGNVRMFCCLLLSFCIDPICCILDNVEAFRPHVNYFVAILHCLYPFSKILALVSNIVCLHEVIDTILLLFVYFCFHAVMGDTYIKLVVHNRGYIIDTPERSYIGGPLLMLICFQFRN